MSCNSFLHLTFGDGLRNPAMMHVGAAGWSLPNPRWLEGGGFLSLCLLKMPFRGRSLGLRRTLGGKVSFPGPKKAALDGVEGLGPRYRAFLVTCASIPISHLQSPIHMYPCQYIRISISADVHSARARPRARVWADPSDTSIPQIDSRPLCETKLWEVICLSFSCFSGGHPLTYR